MILTNPLPNYLKTHIFYLILIAVGLYSFHTWLQEHDQRIQAAQTAQAAITTLQGQIRAQDAAVTQQRAVIARVVTAVKTPAQAIQAIPEVTDAPLNLRAEPEDSTSVEVEALPLFQLLAACKDAQVQLTGCQQDIASEQQIQQQQTQEIAALKKKPRFWKRVAHDAKLVGIGLGIGALLVGAHL